MNLTAVLEAASSDTRSRAVARINVVSVALALVLTAALFWPVVVWVVHQDVDHGLHRRMMEWAVSGSSAADVVRRLPHFVYHLSVLTVDRLVPGLTLTTGMIAVELAAYMATTVVIYFVLREWLVQPQSYLTGLLYVALALALLLVAPINLLTPSNRYLGYIPIAVYHSPTAAVSKPLAVLLFLLVARALQRAPIQPSGRLTLAMALVTVASLLTKPSYVMALLPALGCLLLVSIARRRQLHSKELLFGVIVPASVILAGQALLLTETSGVAVQPLGVFRAWSRVLNPAAGDALLFKLLASVLFPLVAYGVDVPRARRCRYLNVAWLTFVFGALYTYLLVEPGERLRAGNFTWSGQITLFVLFVASAVFALNSVRAADLRPWTNRLRAIVVGLAFGLHLWSGILWYGLHTGGVTMQTLVTGIW